MAGLSSIYKKWSMQFEVLRNEVICVKLISSNFIFQFQF